MDALLAGFSDELAKLAAPYDVDGESIDDTYKKIRKKLKHSGGRLRRLGRRAKETGPGYTTPALIGALATPLIGIIASKGKRALHNRSVKKLMRTATPAMRATLKQQLHRGPILARSRLGMSPYKEPVVTPRDIAFDAIRGGAAGSLVQWAKEQIEKDKKR